MILAVIRKYLRSIYYGAEKDPISSSVRYFMTVFIWPYVKIRYVPIANYLMRAGNSNTTVLELGSGSSGLALFYPYEVTGLDLDFTGPRIGRLKMVYGDSRHIPFTDSSFDYVISLDMLEHLLPSERHMVISEMQRVSRKGMILGFPCGKAAREVELRLWNNYQSKLRALPHASQEKEDLIKRNIFLEQHLLASLPEIDNICSIINAELKKSNIKGSIRIEANERTDTWFPLMNARLDYGCMFFFMSIIINLVPASWLSCSDQNKSYRAILYVEK